MIIFLYFFSDSQWYKVSGFSYAATQSCHVVSTAQPSNSKSLLGDSEKLARKFSIQTVHYADQKLDDFRAREEQKEAEFNKEPVVDELNKNEEQQEEEDEEVIEVRKKILEASLTFVDSVGWTREAIVKGAEQANFPGTVHGMFSRGGIELIDYYYLKCNQQLVEEMKIRTNNGEKVDEPPKEFVKWAIKQRLMMLEPYLQCWPQALAMMTLPQNVPKSLANMLTLVDDICFFTGDRSIDVSLKVCFRDT